MALSKSTDGWYQYKHGTAKIKAPVPAQIFNARLLCCQNMQEQSCLHTSYIGINYTSKT